MEPRPSRRLGVKIATGLVLVLALRAAYLTAAYLGGSATVRKFHVESACLLFVLAGAGLRLLRKADAPSRAMAIDLLSRWTVILWILASLLLYWPALSIGLLSDDFGLVERASRMNLTAFNSEAFRPVPLAIWAALLRLGAGPTALHLLNIVIHGINGYLTCRLVQQRVARSDWSVLAGLIVLMLPTATEAVAWCSGIFDLLATACVLACLLIARAYHPSASIVTRVCFFAAALVGVLSKETAVVTPILVLVDAWGSRQLRRPLNVDVAILMGLFGLYGLERLVFASAAIRQPLTMYMLQRALFGSFSGLTAPWHVATVTQLPWVPVMGAAVVMALVTTFFVARRPSRERTRNALVSTAWILIALLPAVQFFYIAPNLEASRHLYLASVGWAALLATMAGKEDHRAYDRPRAAAVAILLVLLGIGVRSNLGFWRAAADMRDQVELSAQSDPRFAVCETVTLEDLPDNVDGAYVFRNGAPEAFARDLRLRAVLGSETGPCAFRWSDGRFEAAR